MSSLMTTERKTQWTAGTAAVLATLLTLGGPLVLADHYASVGASLDTSGYYAAQRVRYNACRDDKSVSAEVTQAGRRAEVS